MIRCPICGKEADATSITCLKHIIFEYDNNGNLIAYTDMVEVTPGQWQSIKFKVGVGEDAECGKERGFR